MLRFTSWKGTEDDQSLGSGTKRADESLGLRFILVAGAFQVECVFLFFSKRDGMNGIHICARFSDRVNDPIQLPAQMVDPDEEGDFVIPGRRHCFPREMKEARGVFHGRLNIRLEELETVRFCGER